MQVADRKQYSHTDKKDGARQVRRQKTGQTGGSTYRLTSKDRAKKKSAGNKQDKQEAALTGWQTETEG